MSNKQQDPLKTHDTLVDGGALKMALNVLRRAGKDEVADELEKSAVRVTNMTVDEIQHYRHEAEATLKTKTLESRWKQANQMSMSYMLEFEKRGLVYTPLLPVESDSFK